MLIFSVCVTCICTCKHIENQAHVSFVNKQLVQCVLIISNLDSISELVTCYLLQASETAGASCLLLGPPGSNWCFSFAPELVGYSAPRDLHRRAAYSIC